MKKLITGIILFFTLSVHAQSPADLAKLTEGMQLDKSQISNMIDMMVRMGKISKEDANKAKAELNKYSTEDMQALQQQAVQKIKNSSSGSGGLGNILPTKGQQLAAPKNNEKSPASSDAPSTSADNKDSSGNLDGYKEALDYLNRNQ